MDARHFVLWLMMEITIHIVFIILNKRMILEVKDHGAPALRLGDVLKGMLERLFLIIGITAGYPHVITAFGALKIGTRIKNNEKVSNDYFLVGNLISILGALLVVIISKNFIL